MSGLFAPLLDPDRIARAALAALSAAFAAADIHELIEQFSVHPAATYAGPERGEIATGRQELLELLAPTLGRPQRYRFEFDDVRAHGCGSGIWVLADGSGHETSPDGDETEFPYRIIGLLTQELGSWRWTLVSGSAPSRAS